MLDIYPVILGPPLGRPAGTSHLGSRCCGRWCGKVAEGRGEEHGEEGCTKTGLQRGAAGHWLVGDGGTWGEGGGKRRGVVGSEWGGRQAPQQMLLLPRAHQRVAVRWWALGGWCPH